MVVVIVVVNDVIIAAVDPAMAPASNNAANRDMSKHKVEYLEKGRSIVEKDELVTFVSFYCQ